MFTFILTKTASQKQVYMYNYILYLYNYILPRARIGKPSANYCYSGAILHPRKRRTAPRVVASSSAPLLSST